MQMIGLGLVENEVGNDAVVLVSVTQDLLERAVAFAEEVGIAVVLIGRHRNPHD